MKGFKMLRKKEREALLKEIFDGLAEQKYTKKDLNAYMEKHIDEAFVTECRDIINDTDCVITGVGYNKKTDKVIMKLEVTYGSKTVEAGNVIMDLLTEMLEDSDYYE